MLRVNKLTDYAVELLCYMAKSPEKVYNSVELSETTAIAKPTVSKILKLLVAGHLIQSTRGAQGGYQLIRQGTEISVGMVIQTMEGQLAMTACSLKPGLCDHEQRCRTRNNWQKINRAIFMALEEVSIADMNRNMDEIYFNIQQDRGQQPPLEAIL